MRPVVVIRHPKGPRCWIAGQRVHHGATGAVVVAVAARLHGRARVAAAVAGVALAWHDRRDVRVWFTREAPPSVTLLTHEPGPVL